MSVGGMTFSSFTSVLGRLLRNFGALFRPVDVPVVPRSSRLDRDELVGLFDWREGVAMLTSDELRVSERRERQTTQMIRNSLYPRGTGMTPRD